MSHFSIKANSGQVIPLVVEQTITYMRSNGGESFTETEPASYRPYSELKGSPPVSVAVVALLLKSVPLAANKCCTTCSHLVEKCSCESQCM